MQGPSPDKQGCPPELWIIDLGQKGYQYTWDLQLSLVEARRAGRIPDILLLVEHEPIFTMGRHGNWKNLLVPQKDLNDQGIQCFRIERGGDITFHGPGQLVGYTIIKVPGEGRKVKALVDKIENVLLATLTQFEIQGNKDEKNPGVWVDSAKIGAIGLAIRQGVSFHGFALNVNIDLTPFSWIHPCGFEHMPVTSMKKWHPGSLSMVAVKKSLLTNFCRLLGYQGIRLKFREVSDLDCLAKEALQCPGTI